MRYAVMISILLGAAIPSLWTASIPLKASVSAEAALVMNAETGAVLYQKNAHKPLFPASITKIVTALYALEKKGDALDELVIASHDSVATVHSAIRRAPDRGHPPYRLEVGGTHMGIKAGEALPLRTLIYGLMLASGNDAANVIAQHVSGSGTAFIEEINAYIQSKGCKNTIFYTPHGLPHQEHKTTAYDMALLTREAMKFPFFRQVVKTLRYPRGTTNKQADTEFFQHNALLKPGKFFYPKAIGVKTGYTLGSGYTIVAAAEDENRKLITVLLGCQQLAMRYQDAITLFDAAFNEEKVMRTLFSKQFDHFSCLLPGAQTTLTADLSEDLEFRYYPSEEPEFHIDIRWDASALPIHIGQKVGEVCAIKRDGVVLARTDLFAAQAVHPTIQYQVKSMWNRVKTACRQNLAWLMAAIGLGIMGIAFYRYHHRFEKRLSSSYNAKK